jgi:MYXO-CTERM domain-containing protein
MRARWLAAATFVTATLGATTASAQGTRFRFPLGGCFTGCSTVTAYFDRDTSTAIRDWNCGSNTYNSHRGTDIAPFGGFTAQDQDRTIVAAADGTVMTTHDGEADRCTTGSCGGGGGFGNYVVLQHSDGKLSYYAHMRRGSLRVSNGQRVRCGDAIGLVGSSGNSTGAHVHFEVRVGGTATDSFEARAACGGGATHWVSQGAYRALPAESCASVAPPMDAGVAVDSGVVRDASTARDVAIDTAVTEDANVEQDATLEDARVVAQDGARLSDASTDARADARADAGVPAEDWGGCSCRTTAPRRSSAAAGLLALAMAMGARRRRR